MLIGASAVSKSGEGAYWQRVHAYSQEFAALNVISLTCRKIFDERNKGMTGKRLARIPDAVLGSVAAYWVDKTDRSREDAEKALMLLRQLFDRCAQPPKRLLDGESLLEQRIGLLKLHANRQAAHLSLEPYLVDISDLIHVVAALTLVGAIIYDFDNAREERGYFDSLDDAAWQAAKSSFPHLPINRLFRSFDIHGQAAMYWGYEWTNGLDMLLNGLPAALGYWDSEPDDLNRRPVQR
jgi:hypothetical protein